MSDEGSFYMAFCASTLTNDIALGITQPELAKGYALAMVTHHDKVEDVDWRAINEAIIKRWSRSGLERVKKMAHKHFEEMTGHDVFGRPVTPRTPGPRAADGDG